MKYIVETTIFIIKGQKMLYTYEFKYEEECNKFVREWIKDAFDKGLQFNIKCKRIKIVEDLLMDMTYPENLQW